MKFSLHRTAYIWLLAVTGTLLLVTICIAILPTYIEKKIDNRINELQGKTSSISVNLFNRSVRLKDFQWNSPTDSTILYPHKVILNEVRISGIHLVDLLLHKKIVVNNMILDTGDIHFNLKIKRRIQEESNPEYTFFEFKKISLRNIEADINADTVTNYSGVLTCDLADVSFSFDSLHELSYSVGAIEADAKKVQLTLPGEMYTSTVEHFHINTRKGRITVDSVLLIPAYSKYVFAQKAGMAVTRVNLFVQQFNVEGFQFENKFKNSFVASIINIKSFDVHAFKDKRNSESGKPVVPMPMESFLRLPFEVKVDSIIISDSNISVEEFLEGSTTSGTVTFKHVNATFTGLNNRATQDSASYAILKASGLLMGVGSIDALFEFPLDGSAVYRARGSISKMELSALNPALENMVDMRINSGYLNRLVFNFNYTDYVSKGKLDLAYEDLNISGLVKNKSSTNEFKTLLINTIMKKNKSKEKPLSEKIGVIDIERDRKKFIFNLWWKSILDGLKSSTVERTLRPRNDK